MTVFSLFLLICMLIVGGMAVDMMRHETNRARLQATVDRCTLAAADLDQTVNPEDVVRDCFKRAGMSEQLVSVEVNRTARSSRVEVSAGVVVPTFFMRLAGVTELTAPAAATAEESVSNIEVSLVLDISGSMRDNNRLNNLKPAARDFVTQVLDSNTGTSASINLIPYAGQTNPGPVMFDILQAQRINARPAPSNEARNVSSCIEIMPTDFATTALPPLLRQQTPHFMNWTIAANVMDWGWCPEDDTSIIYASDNRTLLHSAINGIRMHDGTGTHYAMRWGLALLDPTSNDEFNRLADAGLVLNAFRDRPRAWSDPDTQKFVVLMTDGQITEQVRPTLPLSATNNIVELQNQASSTRTVVRTAAQNVASFYQSCNLAKENGVIVYTIAFETPAAAKVEMQNCASSPSHFFDANGREEIANAFRQIANQINALRLSR